MIFLVFFCSGSCPSAIVATSDVLFVVVSSVEVVWDGSGDVALAFTSWVVEAMARGLQRCSLKCVWVSPHARDQPFPVIFV